MYKQKLIVIEGACDGIGKSTQYELLKQRLLSQKNKVISHHFPSYNETQGIPSCEYLNGNYGAMDTLSPFLINALYAIDRAITWQTKLKEHYNNGEIILLDRYTTSSLIYQSAHMNSKDKIKEFIDYVVDFEYNKLGLKKPDNVIFLHAPFDLVNQLRKKRSNYEGNINDIHETNMEYMKKVYENAMFIAQYLKWNMVSCSDGNKMKTIESIHENIYKLVK